MESRQKLRDLWRTLPERQREALRSAANGIDTNSLPLRIRGLVTEECQIFGLVLAEWIREEL